jgi:hypothetical protein
MKDGSERTAPNDESRQTLPDASVTGSVNILGQHTCQHAISRYVDRLFAPGMVRRLPTARAYAMPVHWYNEGATWAWKGRLQATLNA